MDLDKFIQDRKPGWVRLRELLDAFESSPVWEGGPERIKELVALYRQACSDLNQVRSYTANPELTGSLNELTGRAYRFVYSEGARPGLRESFWHFLTVQIPATFQQEVFYVIAALLPFLAGALFGFVAVNVDRANAHAFIAPQFFHQSPKERVTEIESEEERIYTMEKALNFGATLYVNNIQVTFLAFASCAMTLVLGVFILFYNGVQLGAMAALYHLDGVATFFYAWVGPHGALELPAIIFGGAAGMRMGTAVLMPGEQTRQTAVRLAFKPVWRMICAAGMILVCAGLIEGSFSQFSVKTVSYEVKIGVALSLFASLLTFLFFIKRGHLMDEDA